MTITITFLFKSPIPSHVSRIVIVKIVLLAASGEKARLIVKIVLLAASGEKARRTHKMPHLIGELLKKI
jgi:hypothetical protein